MLELTKLVVLYPAMRFMTVDLPAPLGPMMAVNSPDLNFPLTPFNKLYYIKARSCRFVVLFLI